MCPCPVSCKPRTICILFQKAAAGKWKWDLRHCKICTLLKCRLNSLQIPTQISCIIFYRDCILASVCMTLHVLNRTKAHCCCQSCFKPNIYLLLCGCHFLSGVQKSMPLPTHHFPIHRSLACMISGETSSDLDAFPRCGREKGHLWCLLWQESWFMCKLPVALYLLGPWRHTQIKGSVGQSWVCAGFSHGRDDRVRVIVQDYQTGSDVLSLFTCRVIHKNKIWHTGGFYSISAECAFSGAWCHYHQLSISGVLHIYLYTEMLCFKYLLYIEREHAPGFFSPLQVKKKKKRHYLSKITSKILY